MIEVVECPADRLAPVIAAIILAVILAVLAVFQVALARSQQCSPC